MGWGGGRSVVNVGGTEHVGHGELSDGVGAEGASNVAK